MLDYDLIKQYQSYNIFIGDVLDSSEIKKQQKGMNDINVLFFLLRYVLIQSI